MKRTSTAAFICFLCPAFMFSCKEKQVVGSAVTIPDYKKGEEWLGKNNDSSFYYFSKVAGSSKDSLEIATSYNNMAAIQADAGDYFGSQEMLLTSLKYLHEQEARDAYCLSSDYNELGNASLNLKNYDAAIEYFDKAIQFSSDKGFIRTFINNKAVCYQQKKEYQKAIALFNSIIEPSKTDASQYARVLSNLARTKWLQDSSYNAAPELITAMQIRQREKNDWGLNASYAHVSDYYAKAKPDSAFFYAEKMYATAKKIQSPDDEMEALKRLIQLGPASGSKQYFVRYQWLGDSLLVARNAAKNQFALIRYEAEKNKADNLKLQKDNADKKLQIIRQRILMYGILLGTIAAAVITFIWYRKRKQQMLLKAENALRQQQLATSQKVHDVVANGLYRIMSEIEYKESLDKEELLDSIEALYEKSRDISYEQPVLSENSFHTTITALLASFASPATKILIRGNNDDTWNKVSPKNKQELQLILEELMVNMKKHSSAENVVIKFERQDKQINIQYTDDGIGFAPSTKHGNGLTNTGNRIKAMGGSIIFDAAAGKGLTIHLNFPINHP